MSVTFGEESHSSFEVLRATEDDIGVVEFIIHRVPFGDQMTLDILLDGFLTEAFSSDDIATGII